MASSTRYQLTEQQQAAALAEVAALRAELDQMPPPPADADQDEQP